MIVKDRDSYPSESSNKSNRMVEADQFESWKGSSRISLVRGRQVQSSYFKIITQHFLEWTCSCKLDPVTWKQFIKWNGAPQASYSDKWFNLGSLSSESICFKIIFLISRIKGCLLQLIFPYVLDFSSDHYWQNMINELLKFPSTATRQTESTVVGVSDNFCKQWEWHLFDKWFVHW